MTRLPAHLHIAFDELGIAELPGASDNPRILEYLETCESLPEELRGHDETAWCSAFVNWVVETAGGTGTNSAWARSWLGWGEASTELELGLVAVFSRGEGGHVGWVVGWSDQYIKVLGGNQGNEVSIAYYPRARLLGLRRAA